MRKTWNHVSRGLAWLSLLLALLTALLWIDGGVGYLRPRLTLRDSPQRYLGVHSGPNMLMISDYRWSPTPIVGPDWRKAQEVTAFQKQFDQQSSVNITLLRLKTLAGPVYNTSRDGRIQMIGNSITVLIPFGLLLPLFLLLPARRWLPGMIRRARARFIIPAGCCQNCGYDLRGTPDRCPECGTVSKTVAGSVSC